MSAQCRYRRCRRFAKRAYCNEICDMGEALALMEDDQKAAMVEGFIRAIQESIVLVF